MRLTRVARIFALSAIALMPQIGCGGGATPEGAGDAASGKDSTAGEGAGTGGERDLVAELGLDQRDFPLLIWSAFIVGQDYFDQSRFDTRAQLESAMHDLSLHAPELIGELDGNALVVTVGTVKKSFDISGAVDLKSAADLLEQVLVFCRDQLALEGEPLHELEYAAINGFLAPLDPHTLLLTPEETADLGIKTRGSFGGIGAEVRIVDKDLVVLRVLPDSPAAAAGIVAGDVILKIAGQSTVNIEPSEAQMLMRGPVGTTVVVELRRGEKKERLTVEVTRQLIRVQAVRSALLDKGLGYIAILAFQEDTDERFGAALNELKAQAGDAGLKGLVIDLRGNSGGLLQQAAQIVDRFTDDGELVIVRSVGGREAEVAKPGVDLPPTAPVIVLVNEESASAAEIVAGSLQGLGRAVVLGRSSFGKGTVQMMRGATPYGRELGLKLSVAEYRVSGEGIIQTRGVRPDLTLVPVEPLGLANIARYYDEERFDREREKTRIAGLPSAKHEILAGGEPKPSPVLRYLAEPRINSNDVPELLDPEIDLARHVLAALAAAPSVEGRPAALAAAATALGSEEDARVEKALESASNSLQWERTSAAVPASPLLAVTTSLDTPELRAGKPFVVRVDVVNNGTEALDRVHLITRCQQESLNAIEVLIGRIEPGAKASRALELVLPPSLPSLEEKLRFAAYVEGVDDRPIAEGEVLLKLTGLTRPTLALDYWIVDDPTLVAKAPARPTGEPAAAGEETFQVKGNGDGVLNPGESVLVALRVSNRGPGFAGETKVLVRNLSGAQGLLEEGEARLGELDAGGRASASIGLTVSPSADPGLPLELELGAGDPVLRESVREKIRFKIVESGEQAKLASGVVTIGKDGAALRIAGEGTARSLMAIPEGEKVAVVGRVGAWYIVDAGEGRRLFFVAEGHAYKEGNDGAAKSGSALLASAGKASGSEAKPAKPMIDPPRLEVVEAPTSVRGTTAHIVLEATDPVSVRDVSIQVRAAGPGQQEHKVHYQAFTAKTLRTNKDGSVTARIEVDVPLQPGSNRIMVIARDAERMSRRRDLWILSLPAGVENPAP